MGAQEKRIVYSCSGCSSAGQMANWIAVELDQAGAAEMSCIAGIGGRIAPLLERAQEASEIIGIDGCPLHCVRHCLRREGMDCAVHVDLSKYGVIKKYHQDFDVSEAEKTLKAVVKRLNGKPC
ncbi:MAG: putative zinc-binding protein [Candidatus Omnitrophica bacterium]|nr:putative zinc-binding protein [Candidatus Omnitrophota bacterium]